ncbi:nuclease domain-containing protein, partial [Lactococcus garvieae]|uniref:nuclease domain-containing protein n=2 Tax=Streptococcaceae TaxID=1300 RepID=UPI00254BF927
LQDYKSFSRKSINFLRKIEEEISNEVKKESRYSFYRTSARNNFREKRHENLLFEKQEEIKRLSSFINYIEDFLRSDSFNKISDEKPRFIPKSLILAPHYNKVYKAYLMLHDKKDSLKLDKPYRYFWRSTELLYEIWSYIKTIEALMNKGFEPISGWIFNTSEYAEILPFLKDGTKVTLRKDDIRLDVVFNEKLKTKSFRNTLEFPLKTYSNRNKPDIRIDIFMSELPSYIGSIILDAKYKRLHNIISSNYGHKQLNQLRDYRKAVFSSIIDFDEISMKQTDTVQAVFAVYPIKDRESSEERSFDEENILFSELRPEKGMELFSQKLISQIEDRIIIWRRYDIYRKYEL